MGADKRKPSVLDEYAVFKKELKKIRMELAGGMISLDRKLILSKKTTHIRIKIKKLLQEAEEWDNEAESILEEIESLL